jgi:glutamine synthetase adenylyltransferase
LKTSPGGSYDIDFLTSYLVIRNGIHAAQGTIADRLQLLGRAGLISLPDLDVLLGALELFRTADHAVRLVTGRLAKTVPASDLALNLVEEVTSRMLSRPLAGALDAALDSARAAVRDVFDRLLA